jgi:hypothetical protein
MMPKKNIKKTSDESKDEFFVAIGNPAGVRKGLLESRKTILQSMRVFHALKEVRKKKTEQKNLLRKQLRQVSGIISKIKSSMPHVSVPLDALTEKAEGVSKDIKKDQKVPVVKPDVKREVDRIEDELKEIESKLTHL